MSIDEYQVGVIGTAIKGKNCNLKYAIGELTEKYDRYKGGKEVTWIVP